MMRTVSEFEELNKAVRAPNERQTTRMDAPHDRATWQQMEGWPWHPWLNSEHVVSTEYPMVRCAVEGGLGAQ